MPTCQLLFLASYDVQTPLILINNQATFQLRKVVQTRGHKRGKWRVREASYTINHKAKFKSIC